MNKEKVNKESAFLEKRFQDKKYYCYLKCDDELADYPHFHSRFELLYLLEGSCEAVINGNTFFAKSGDLIMVNKFEVHYYKFAPKKIKCLVLVFDDEYLEDFYNFYGQKRVQCFGRNPDANEKIKKILDDWMKEGTENCLKNSGYINLIMSVITSYYMAFGDGESPLLLTQILDYLQKHYTENLTASAVAKKMGYSQAYFSYIFNKLVGVKFRTYLNGLRLNKAQNLLNDKSKRVEDAAIEAGFSDAAAYYRALRNSRKI